MVVLIRNAELFLISSQSLFALFICSVMALIRNAELFLISSQSLFALFISSVVALIRNSELFLISSQSPFTLRRVQSDQQSASVCCSMYVN